MFRTRIKKAGFSSTYFLSVFTVLLTLAGILEINTQNRLKTAIYVQELNRYLSEESVVLSTVKCKLKNQNYEEEEFYESDVNFSLTFFDSSLEATIYAPIAEVLVIQIDKENQSVIDYTPYR